MGETSWEVEEDGVWYRVTARATCPKCGLEFSHREERRVAAGMPHRPELIVTVNPSGTVELSAVGSILPMVEHTCGAPGRR